MNQQLLMVEDAALPAHPRRRTLQPSQEQATYT
jgi:hypothetical protein